MELTKVKFIRNPKSGILRTQNLIRKAIEWNFSDADFEYDIVETQYAGHGRILAKEAVEQGYDAVIAVGGDGTTNEIGSALVYTDTALGIIPLGSGNGLARGMGISMQPMKAADTIKTGRIRTIDAAQIEGEVFFIVTGFGFDALIGKMFNEQKIRGIIPYFTIGFREYRSYKYEVIVLKFDDRQVAVSALFITIANLKGWGGGAIISPDAEFDDGLLDICVIHRAPWWYILANLYKLFTGGVVRLRKYSRYQAKNIEMIREGPGPYHFDGESREGGTVLHISVLPQALKVIVPDE
ncbi:diacylglycerol kinase family lipid kinase [candidate division KSB1 bacterium]|nr:diacylglycerol kinase family lipid kinase [candidate division KSB1 bacterium]RQW01473.1 MAG: diacylglycerol kinase family lipid kinase [candidate division KSB1 bacterium]